MSWHTAEVPKRATSDAPYWMKPVGSFAFQVGLVSNGHAIRVSFNHECGRNKEHWRISDDFFKIEEQGTTRTGELC